MDSHASLPYQVLFHHLHHKLNQVANSHVSFSIMVESSSTNSTKEDDPEVYNESIGAEMGIKVLQPTS